MRTCSWLPVARASTKWNSREASWAARPERAFSSRAIERVELGQVGVAAALGGQARDPRLEDQPHLQPAQHRVEPELGRPEPAVRVRVHEALGAQAPQRLAHGRPGDPEALGELDLPEPRARRDVTVQDELADALVGEVHDAVDLKHEAAQ